jgi:hypothetical protein
MLYDTFDRTGNAEFPFPKEVVFRAMYTAITQLPGMGIESHDQLASRIDVKTGMTAFSWGERVSINVNGNGSNAAVVSVQSAAKTVFGSATTHGKNRQNVRNIINQTSRLLAQYGAQWMDEMGLKPSEGVAPDSKSNSVADELMKLADLRDRGILTPEEFDRQKTKLLGG